MDKTRAHIVVSGHVQGVFFRANTSNKALELGLYGRVINLKDGTVDIIVEGPQKKIQNLIEWCRQGPPRAKVTHVKTEWHSPTGQFHNFSIEY